LTFLRIGLDILLLLLRGPIRIGTIMRSLVVSYNASKQAWTQSIRIIRGSACVPVGCV
jgi:hypothetical protein